MKQDITWLSVIGINENGLAGLSEQAREAISSAALVVGGKRHLELAGNVIKNQAMVWESPIDKTIKTIIAKKPEKVCVLASGDPFCYGVGVTLSRQVPIAEMLVIPAPSTFSLAAAKLGWALQDTITIGLNGREIRKIIPHLQPNAKILALSTDETTPEVLAELLISRGFGDCRFSVLEHLGGDKERIRNFTAKDIVPKAPIVQVFSEIPGFAGMAQKEEFAKLNMVAIEITDNITSKNNAVPLSSGLADELFEHDGQLTKREIRAITLSALAPRKGELLWDIGLGAGSVAIEWLLRSEANRAIGFERNKERADRAQRNALKLGVPHLKIVLGDALEKLQTVEAPDAIFIGGGAGNITLIETAWNALKSGGRLVANSVTLETEAVILAASKKYGGTLTRIAIERSEPVGSMTGMRPSMSVLQWSVSK